MKTRLAALAALGALLAVPAAAQGFTSTFENVPGGPGPGGFTTVATADGWTGTNGIELQNRVAGTPAPGGGDVFVELDTSGNSAMSRTIGAGLYQLSFLYSPRPGVGSASNGIEVLLGGTSLYSITGDGAGDTVWATQTLAPFVASAGSTLTFRAIGTSDSLGGYIDNITLSAVPEPATWATMMLGFGLVGFGLRSRRTSRTLAAA